MESIKISKYLKLIDIQRILMHVFNRTKRPSFIQFRSKPKSIILVFLNIAKTKIENNNSLSKEEMEDKNVIENNNSLSKEEMKDKNVIENNNSLSKEEMEDKNVIENNNSLSKEEMEDKNVIENNNYLSKQKMKDKTDITNSNYLSKQETQYDSFINKENMESTVTEKEIKCSEKLYNAGIRTYCSINESLNLDLIYKNLLNDISVKNNNLDFITEEAIDMLEKHDIYQIFSYAQSINYQTDFDRKVFENYVKPNKKTKYFLIGIDCEMFITEAGKRAGRVSMVDNTGKLLYDKYVIPPEPVIDFLEEYSGLNKDNTKNGIEFKQMQKEILEFIGTNTYICGHGLENDLEVLELYTERIIDTAYLFLNSQGYKLKLKQLTWCYLKEIIQTGKHNPVEDALSCLKLLNFKIQQLIKINDFKSNKIKLNGNIQYIDELDEIKNYMYLSSLFFYKADIEEVVNIRRTSDTFPLFFYEEEGKIFLAYY